MLLVEGYISLSEIHDWIGSGLDARIRHAFICNKVEIFNNHQLLTIIKKITCKYTWETLENSTDVKILTSTGTLLTGSLEIVEPTYDVFSETNGIINIEIGSIVSQIERWVSGGASTLKAFAGLPVFVKIDPTFRWADSELLLDDYELFLVANEIASEISPEAHKIELELFLDDVNEKAKTTATETLEFPVEGNRTERRDFERMAARKLIDIHASNPRLTKKTIHSNYFSSMTIRSYNRAWQDASEKRPEMSKPGRKSD